MKINGGIMQVLCYNHRGQLKALSANTLYPVGTQVHFKGPLQEDIYLVVTEHVSGEKHGLDADITIMMVSPLKGHRLIFQKKVCSWFSLGMFVSRDMLVH